MSGWKLTLLVAVCVGALAGGVYLGASYGSDSTNVVGAPAPSTSSTVGPDVATTTAGEDPAATATTRAPTATSGCEVPPGEPFVGGPSVQLTPLGEVNGVAVEAALYPHPDYEGDPWTMWGQGVALEDGRFYSAIGDHLGPDGNSYVYEYDPASGSLAMVGDVLSYVDHQPGSWGYGKIHGQMVLGPCGEVYFSSYWGTYRDLRFGGSYEGDILFRLDPQARTIENLGVPVPEHGVASLAGSVEHGLVYGEAIDPLRKVVDVDEGPFFAFDIDSGEVVFEGPSTPHTGYRNMIVDAAGRAYYSVGGSALVVYDPATNDISEHPSTMPGDWLRASTAPDADGRLYGVTEDPAVFFAMEPSGEIRSLGDSLGYTTSMALHPDGERFFYVPDAHGSAWTRGAPLMSVDTATGEQTIVAELNGLAEANLGVRLGGTYGLAVSPSGDAVYIGMNVGPLGADNGFGEVALLVVHLP